LQKCFENNIYTISFYHKLNHEFEMNSKNIKKSNLGLSFKRFNKCLSVIKKKKIFKTNYPNKFFNGQIKILKHLKEINNNH
jgi:hypothetical protein